MSLLDSPNSPWKELANDMMNCNPSRVTISSLNSGGCECLVKGLKGFIPYIYLAVPPDDYSELEGKSLEVIPTEVSRQKNKLILSEKRVLEFNRYSLLNEGDLVEGKVSEIKYNNVLVDLGEGVRGSIHKNSISPADMGSLELEKVVSVRILEKKNINKFIHLILVDQAAENPREHLKDLNNLSHEIPSSPPEKSVMEKEEELQSLHEQLLSKGLILGKQFFVSRDSEFVLRDAEYKLLCCLSQHLGQTVPHLSLIQKCGTVNISVIIRSLNSKLNGFSIENEKGKGYRLEEDKV